MKHMKRALAILAITLGLVATTGIVRAEARPPTCVVLIDEITGEIIFVSVGCY